MDVAIFLFYEAEAPFKNTDDFFALFYSFIPHAQEAGFLQ